MGNCAGNELERQEMQGGERPPWGSVHGLGISANASVLKRKYDDHRAAWKCFNRTGFFPLGDCQFVKSQLFYTSSFQGCCDKPQAGHRPQLTDLRAHIRGSVLVLFLWEGGGSPENVTQ